MKKIDIFAAALLVLLIAGSGSAQQQPLSLDQAVQQALDKYPAVRGSLEQVSAAAAGINLARTAYLPRLDVLGQVNRATHNNVFGMLLPQPVISPISGPVLGTNAASSVWGSAIGALVSWEPFDFGSRSAQVDLAEAVWKRLGAQVDVTRLQVGAAAADAFLAMLAAQETVEAAQAAVQRSRILSQAIEVLVTNELRPGADASRTRAELALAENQLIRAEEAVDLARASLAQFLGVAPQSLAIRAGPLLTLPGEQEIAAFVTANHPAAAAQRLAVDEVKAREKVLQRAYFPRFTLQGTSFGRGTGARTDGAAPGGASGLGPDIGNWAVGLTVTFPIFDIASIRARREIEIYNERAETARYDQILQDLNGQTERAKARLTAARRVAQNTPIELEAARTTQQQANARYKAGLAGIVEVAEADRILAQAEIDDALARLGVWRGLLGIAAASGDLEPFLRQVRK